MSCIGGRLLSLGIFIFNHPQPKTDSSPSPLAIRIVKMLPLNAALLSTLNALGQHPNLQFTDPNEEGWRTITLSWPAGDDVPEKIFKFEISVGDEPGGTVACVLERVGLTYNWGERFMALLYSNIDQLPVDIYLPPSDMPPLEDVHMNEHGEIVIDEEAPDPLDDIYADMPPLENGGLHTVG